MKKMLKNVAAFAVCGALCFSCVTPAFAAEKDETVYVLCKADGEAEKIIVSDWIQNTPRQSSLKDFTRLFDVENIKGDEPYNINENGIVWDAKGNDIYYRGSTEKELPVNMTVSYKFDGKSISADDIAGKSGKVAIRFEYENRQSETVTIDGKEEKINVPFAMLTGMIFDNDRFKNIEVSNGKLMNDGDRTAVIGFAFPGLRENLKIDKDNLDIPEYVEITADVNDFRLGMTVTLVTNEIFNDIDASKIYCDEDLSQSVLKLTEGMKQLLDGSSALYEGLDTLLEKSGEMMSGIEKLAEGANSLKDGAVSLDNGADELMKGAAELSVGLDTLKSSNDTLNNAAKKVFEKMLLTAESQIKAAGVTVPKLTAENYADTLNYIIESLESEAAKKSIAALKASLDDYNAFYIGLNTYTDGVASAADGAAALASGTSDLKSGTTAIMKGSVALCDGINALNDGAPALVEGVSGLKDGAMQLNAGLTQFNDEGIVKIINLADGDIGNFVARLKATIDVSKDYVNYSGIDENMTGQVKFVYKTKEIE